LRIQLTGPQFALLTGHSDHAVDGVDLPDPVPGDGEQLFNVSSSGVNLADTHHRLSAN
jgi:NADPH:quinone reductase-like Zn-dependent oxidoreductase